MMVVDQRLKIWLPFSVHVPILCRQTENWQCFAWVVFVWAICRLYCLLYCLVQLFQVPWAIICQKLLSQNRAVCCPVNLRILFSLDFESISSCVELLDTFAGTALRSGYDAWFYVVEKNFMRLLNWYRGINLAAGTDDANEGCIAAETRFPQNLIPIETPSIDAAKFQSLLH